MSEQTAVIGAVRLSTNCCGSGFSHLSANCAEHKARQKTADEAGLLLSGDYRRRAIRPDQRELVWISG
jgi:hypothetical protein